MRLNHYAMLYNIKQTTLKIILFSWIRNDELDSTQPLFHIRTQSSPLILEKPTAYLIRSSCWVLGPLLVKKSIWYQHEIWHYNLWQQHLRHWQTSHTTLPFENNRLIRCLCLLLCFPTSLPGLTSKYFVSMLILSCSQIQMCIHQEEKAIEKHWLSQCSSKINSKLI